MTHYVPHENAELSTILVDTRQLCMVPLRGMYLAWPHSGLQIRHWPQNTTRVQGTSQLLNATAVHKKGVAERPRAEASKVEGSNNGPAACFAYLHRRRSL